MTNHARPLLLGYIRSDVLSNGTELPQVRARLEAFAEQEEFSLGTVYVAQRDALAAFHALMGDVVRDEAWGVVVPDLRHMTVVEQLALSCYETGAQTAIFPALLAPQTGGPGAFNQTRVGPAVPPVTNGAPRRSPWTQERSNHGHPHR